jgi:hypothetical protein
MKEEVQKLLERANELVDGGAQLSEELLEKF